jgi:hypothetical protein
MMSLEQTADGFALSLSGPTGTTTLPVPSLNLDFMATHFTFKAITELLASEEPVTCGAWRLERADVELERPRDLKRSRLVLHIDEQKWHFIPDELIVLGSQARRIVRGQDA